ncbi:uncharacterized protein B0J16DRAFT_405679 [Fusarium flagelliforme]|uniref:uncharacterized protein n=1 Tax=Fusarium flagelliforme TaxID=2675880 RepID=UPI001E8DF0CE|nr:uncharacterized protein B0J16DRAFT_405679 [Fusarium flagelliforme]KAH7173285.1 hypothetical protein B0J16DRAFT_405679 [Fusarium flagelliforme]
MSDHVGVQMDGVSISRDSGYADSLKQVFEGMEIYTGDDKTEIGEELYESTKGVEDWPQPAASYITEQAERARIRLFCRVCGEKGEPADLVLCSGCGAPHMPAHRRCLYSSPIHQLSPDEPTMYGNACEEIDFQQYIYTSSLLDSRFLNKDKASLHVDDLWSTWFGVAHEQTGHFPQLSIYPRLQTLVDVAADRPPRQYPSLISFVGDTGSGKSTLIRAIIRMLAPRAHESFQVPVQGTAGDGFDSTSSDVHLFADPNTGATEVPRFFVDCEGFSGTDTPVARQLVMDAAKAPVSRAMQDGTLRPAPAPAVDPLARHTSSASIRVDLQWGKVLAPVEAPSALGRKRPGQVDPKSRNMVVKNVYPRLLYAFSDVVCFVTNNSRASQNILEQMFRWAKDGHERTLNQRVRPGLIIVLNKMPMDSHNVLSSIKNATRQLLESFQKSTRFQELQQKWRARGRNIQNAEELILCYYDSFRVISIPQHTPSSPAVVQVISDQVRNLYNETLAMSEDIRRKRKSLNLDLDVSSLNAYLHRSVMALGRDFHSALDFHELSDGDSALPRRFSEHLCQVMFRMTKLRNFDTSQAAGGEADLVLQMTPYIAACIIAQIDDAKDQEDIQKSKEALVDEAQRGLKRFREQFWRCEAKDSSGQRRCKNYRQGHDKGHQFETSTYTPLRGSHVSVEDIEVGPYECSYDPVCFTDQLWDEIFKLHDRTHAIDKLASAATSCGVTGATTQRTCLSCLSNTPTNMLPCKPQEHGVCEDCIKRCNHSTGEESLIQMSFCPLGCSFTCTPWSIRVKPRTAGARILTLDGGGIRGIIELVILSKIEKEVGLGIRIQELFDLVIGTSTGGLVALGVFERNWNMGHAENIFSDLSRQAFSIRKALAVPVISKFAEPFCEFKYKSAGINNSLQKAFEGDYLFGQTKNRRKSGDQVKVGVVAQVEGRNQPCLIANYSRNPIDKQKDGTEAYDCLQREDEQSNDFLTWQAARATSAAPILFKPYIHQQTQKVYIDGAVVRNNPVRLAYEEATRIWKSTKPPDIIVSVGTGILVDDKGALIDSKSSHMDTFKAFLPKGIRKKVETGMDMVQATLDCRREWLDFNSQLRGRQRDNCHRLDVGLTNKPPALDDVDRIYWLRGDAQRYLHHEAGSAFNYFQRRYSSPSDHIRTVARRLLASLFYLSDTLPRSMYGGSIRTTLHCRLSRHSEGAPALVGNMNGPSFRIREVNDNGEEIVRPIQFLTAEKFNQKTMSAPVEVAISDGSYERCVEVQFPRRGKHWEAIGGF